MKKQKSNEIAAHSWLQMFIGGILFGGSMVLFIIKPLINGTIIMIGGAIGFITFFYGMNKNVEAARLLVKEELTGGKRK